MRHWVRTALFLALVAAGGLTGRRASAGPSDPSITLTGPASVGREVGATVELTAEVSPGTGGAAPGATLEASAPQGWGGVTHSRRAGGTWGAYVPGRAVLGPSDGAPPWFVRFRGTLSADAPASIVISATVRVPGRASATATHTVTVEDVSPPRILDASFGPAPTITAEGRATVPFAFTVSDDLAVRPDAVVVAVSADAGLVATRTLSWPTGLVLTAGSRSVTVSGTVAVTGIATTPAFLRLTIEAQDVGGNEAAPTELRLSLSTGPAPRAGISIAGPLSCDTPMVRLVASSSGGAAPVRSTWSTDDLGFAMEAEAPGAYGVVLTGADKATSEASVVVAASGSRPDVRVASPVTLSCASPTATLVAQAAGGTLPYTRSWARLAANGASTGLGNATDRLTVMEGGRYRVEVVDGHGCRARATVRVLETKTPPTVWVPEVEPPTCTLPEVRITPTVSGGMPPYDHLWKGPNGSVLGTEAGLHLSGSPPASVTYRVRDAAGCETTQIIAVPPNRGPPVVALAGAGSLTCACDMRRIEARVTGGQAPYAYRWSTGAEGPAIRVDQPGTYSLTVKGANGCAATASAVVGLQREAPTVSVVVSGEIDPPLAPTAEVRATVGGGAAPYDLVWTDAAGAIVSRELAFTASAPGTYTLRATGTNGCSTEVEARVRTALVAIEPGGFIYDWAQSDRFLVVLSGPKHTDRREDEFRDLTAYAQPDGTRLWTRRYADAGIYTQDWRRPHSADHGVGRSIQLFDDRLAFVGTLERGAANVGLHVLDVAQEGRSVAFHRKGASITTPSSGPHAFGTYGAVVDLATGRRLMDSAPGRRLQLVGVVGGMGLYVRILPEGGAFRRVLTLVDPTTGAEVWRAGDVASAHIEALQAFHPLILQDDFPVLFDCDDGKYPGGLLFVGRDGTARLLDRAALGISPGQVSLSFARTRRGMAGRILVVGLVSGGPQRGPSHETFVAIDEQARVLGRLDVPAARTEIHWRDLSEDVDPLGGELLVARTDFDVVPASHRQSLACYTVPTSPGGAFVERWVRHPDEDFGMGDVQEVVRCGDEILLQAAPGGLLGLRVSDGAISRVLGPDELGTGPPKGYRLFPFLLQLRARRDAHHLFVHEWISDDAMPNRIVRVPWSARGELSATLTVPEPVFTDRDVPITWTPAAASLTASAGTLSGATWHTPSTPGPVVLTLRSGDVSRSFPVTVLDKRTVEDTDWDGLTDAEEIRLRTDPADPSTGPDPLNADSDSDDVGDLFDLSPMVRPSPLRWETVQRTGMLRSELPIRALGVDGWAEVWSTGFLGSESTLRGRWSEEGTKASVMDEEHALARLSFSPGAETGDFRCFDVVDAERHRFDAPDEPEVVHERIFQDHVIGRTKTFEFRYRQLERWFVAHFMNRVPLAVPARTEGGPPPYHYLLQAVKLRPGLAHRFAIQVRHVAPEAAEGLGLTWALYASDRFEDPATVPLVEGFAPFIHQGTHQATDPGMHGTAGVVGTFEIRLSAAQASLPNAWLKLTAVRRTGQAGATEVVSVVPPTEVTGLVRQVVLEDDAEGRRSRSIVQDLRGIGGLAEDVLDESQFVEGPASEGGATRLPDVPVQRIERVPDGWGGWITRIVGGVTTVVVRGGGVPRALGASAALVKTGLSEWYEAASLEKALRTLPKDHWARSPSLGPTLVGFQTAQGVATVVVGVGRTISAIQEGDEVKATVTAGLTAISAFGTATGTAKTAVAFGLVEKGSRIARFSKLASERAGVGLAIATGIVSVGYDVYRYEGETDPILRLKARERISADLFNTSLGIVAVFFPPLAAAQATWTVGVELYRLAFGADFAYRVSKDLGGALVFVASVLVTDNLPSALCDEAWRTVKGTLYATMDHDNEQLSDLWLTVFVDPDQP